MFTVYNNSAIADSSSCMHYINVLVCDPIGGNCQFLIIGVIRKPCYTFTCDLLK